MTFDFLLPPAVVAAGQVRIAARVTDPAGVKEVVLRCRSLAPGEKWQSVPMEEKNGGYEATVPLTPAGLAYRLDITDTWDNTAMFPDYRKETPYRIVRP